MGRTGVERRSKGTMSRRVIGIVAALLLALLGTVALVAWVSNAEERALEGEELVEVYVVTTEVPGGTPAEDLDALVEVEQVPTKVRAEGAVDSLPSLSGLVAAVDLLPGEQLVESRFVERTSLTDRAVGIDVPEDMIEITIELEPERAVGGLLQPGQTVAVFASFDPFQLTASVVEIEGEEVALPSAVASEAAGSTPNTTDLLLRKVLVTAVQEDQSGFGDDEEADRIDTSPEDDLLVTLAVPPFDAERVIFTAEFGRLWLAIERDTVPEADDPIQTRGTVYLDEVTVR
jgi:pilus assembly protein CpaB